MIYVRVDGKVYADTKENFEQDFGVTFPPLPEGAIERIYDQGRRHVLHEEGNVIGGGDMPWELGDQIIADVDRALDLKKQRDDELKKQRDEEEQKRQEEYWKNLPKLGEIK